MKSHVMGKNLLVKSLLFSNNKKLLILESKFTLISYSFGGPRQVDLLMRTYREIICLARKMREVCFLVPLSCTKGFVKKKKSHVVVVVNERQTDFWT